MAWAWLEASACPVSSEDVSLGCLSLPVSELPEVGDGIGGATDWNAVHK